MASKQVTGIPVTSLTFTHWVEINNDMAKKKSPRQTKYVEHVLKIKVNTCGALGGNTVYLLSGYWLQRIAR